MDKSRTYVFGIDFRHLFVGFNGLEVITVRAGTANRRRANKRDLRKL
jgi:hypothetical protein